METMKKIIIDTDIGDDIDDAYALAFAVKLRRFDILGVTTVYRNCLQRAKIASALLKELNAEGVDVYVGNDYPRKEKLRVEAFEEVLADGRPVIPHYSDRFASACVSETPAAEFIAACAEKYPNEVTVVAIGPLTNLADVAERYPQSYCKLKNIVCMGGNFDREKCSRNKAEWNIRCDPESAAAVLDGGVPITFIGVEVTSYAKLDDAAAEELARGSDGVTRMLDGMMKKWLDTHPGRKSIMHDALTVAEVLGGYCTYRTANIVIPLEGEKRAYTDFAEEGAGVPVTYAVGVNREAFMRRFLETVKDKVSV